MNPFDYLRPTDVDHAIRTQAQTHGKFLGGGTNLVDLMRETIEHPKSVIDVTGLSREIKLNDRGSLWLGAAAKNTAVAEHPLVRENFPAVARALLAGASPQIRNMATVGGNILQRTRCAYFYDNEGSHCNKRNPGEGCDAIKGFNRMHAILGTSEACIAANPSDFAIPLAAFDTIVHVKGPKGDRAIAFTDLHRLPENRPDRETHLQAGELITALEIPKLSYSKNSTYRKVRDRSSYAFALVSVAAAVDIEDGIVKDVRLACGGVGTVPWRARDAEAALIGRPATFESFRAAAQTEFVNAKLLSHNAFKSELAVRTITAVLTDLSGGNQ